MDMKNNVVANLPDEENNVPVETGQYIVIRLGDEQYGIDIRNIDNIIKMQPITRIPKMQPYLKGVISMRGEVVPVISMRLKFGLPADEITKDTRIIVLKLEQEGKVGFIVDEVKEVVTLFSNEVEKITYDSKEEKAGMINAVGKHNGELISLLDLNAISLEGN
ncbi:MAG: chemotaxis protein CheW [Roseburia sp.]|nr:chemotaxis protein CheW [Roseburia sp.]MCM1096993.1 chemotaxis protein CheW [Ruminococcus flavefaciens]